MRSDRLRPDTAKGIRRPLAALCVLVLAGGCGASTPTMPITGSVTPPPAASSAEPTVTSAPAHISTSPPVASGPVAESPSALPASSAPSPSLVPAHWVPAGTMHLAHSGPAVLRLGDGRVLAVGSNQWDYHVGYFADETSVVAELWSPATNAWRVTAPLNDPRADFTAVVLQDGRAMVIGGLNGSMAAYSSVYLFDPATERWSKTGLMTTARAGAGATVLGDGRVLVVGGRYTSGLDYGSMDGMTLAAFEREADIGPPGPADHPLATAELYDPRTGTWSSTGPMRYARSNPSAARLGDGRVLVWGGDTGDGAPVPAEIYDPSTGRFRLAPALPRPSAESLIAIGVAPERDDWRADSSAGGLLGLAIGDALLVGMQWSSDTLRIEQFARFDTSRDRWSLLGAPYAERLDAVTGSVTGHWGAKSPTGAVAALPGGQLLVASGGSSRRVDRFDPVRNRWARLPSLPAAIPEAAAVALEDGSILLSPTGGPYVDSYRFLPAS